MLQLCDHPNVVRLVDHTLDTPEEFYLVLVPWAPYALAQLINQDDHCRLTDAPWFTPDCSRTEQIVIRIFRGLADGLDYLHDKSIKHKDLKPDNILLYNGSRGIQPVIADLGISKIWKEGNSTDFDKSTFPYLALEQVNRVGSTTQSDVWQLGCCLDFLIVVFRKGTEGGIMLGSSFNYTDDKCSWNFKHNKHNMKVDLLQQIEAYHELKYDDRKTLEQFVIAFRKNKERLTALKSNPPEEWFSIKFIWSFKDACSIWTEHQRAAAHSNVDGSRSLWMT